jgi:hypothetical protein
MCFIMNSLYKQHLYFVQANMHKNQEKIQNLVQTKNLLFET